MIRAYACIGQTPHLSVKAPPGSFLNGLLFEKQDDQVRCIGTALQGDEPDDQPRDQRDRFLSALNTFKFVKQIALQRCDSFSLCPRGPSHFLHIMFGEQTARTDAED